MEKHTIIAIGREYGSHGLQIGKRLAEDLGLPYYDQAILQNAALKSGVDLQVLKQHDEQKKNNMFYSLMMSLSPVAGFPEGETLYQKMYQVQVESILDLAAKGPCIFIGRCADYVLRDYPNVIKVFVHAPLEYRVPYISNKEGISLEEARRKITRIDKDRATYYNYNTGQVWSEMRNYDLCINTEHMSIGSAVELIKFYMKERDMLKK